MPTLRPEQMIISTGVADNDSVTTKGYVDEHTENGIWKKSGTEVSLANVSNTIESDYPLSYTGHPTFTDATQIVDKKYVDDQIAAGAGVTHNVLTVATPGQTTFTLTNTPVDADRSILMLNGQGRDYGAGKDYTISGTTLTWNDPAGLTLKTADSFQIWYDITIAPPGTLDQEQMYYVGKAGSDTNSGKSVEFPFLTIGAAITAVNAQVPGIANTFKIHVIGGGTYLSDTSFTIPQYTILDARDATIQANITMATESGYLFHRHINITSGTCITANSSGNRYIRGDYVTPAVGGKFIFTGTSAFVYLDVNQLDMTASGAQVYSANSGSVIYLNVHKFKETAASYNDGSARVFEYIQDKGSNADTTIINPVGDLYIETPGFGDYNIIAKTNVEVFRTQGNIIKWTNTPLVYARPQFPLNGVTGDSTVYTVIFDQEIKDFNNNYNPVTGVFTVPKAGMYLVTVQLDMQGITSNNTFGEIKIANSILNLNPLKGNFYNMSTGGHLYFSTSMIVELVATDSVSITLQVNGEPTKNIDIWDASFGVWLFSGI